jgi:mannosyltransferase OCH1-like enzyme
MYTTYSAVVAFYLLLIAISAIAQGSQSGYDLPVLPSAAQISASLNKLPDLYRGIVSATFIGTIPRIFWVTMKDIKPNDVAPHIKRVFDHHQSWKAVVADDAGADAFMRIVYANTSLLWAYDMINPSLGAAKADLWRYSVLYAVGGVYFDADSAFSSSLDKVILFTEHTQEHFTSRMRLILLLEWRLST